MTRLLSSLLVVAALAATALADTVGDGYHARPVGTDIPWMTYIYVVVAAAATAVVGFKSANRTHLD